MRERERARERAGERESEKRELESERARETRRQVHRPTDRPRHARTGGPRWIGTRVAGASWKRITASAPWAARQGHTSVLDAAGNIFVLGGSGDGDTTYNDVWRSADHGAAPAGRYVCATVPGIQ